MRLETIAQQWEIHPCQSLLRRGRLGEALQASLAVASSIINQCLANLVHGSTSSNRIRCMRGDFYDVRAYLYVRSYHLREVFDGICPTIQLHSLSISVMVNESPKASGSSAIPFPFATPLAPPDLI